MQSKNFIMGFIAGCVASVIFSLLNPGIFAFVQTIFLQYIFWLFYLVSILVKMILSYIVVRKVMSIPDKKVSTDRILWWGIIWGAITFPILFLMLLLWEGLGVWLFFIIFAGIVLSATMEAWVYRKYTKFDIERSMILSISGNVFFVVIWFIIGSLIMFANV